MGLLNPRFDVPGVNPGEAEHWTLLTHVEAERIVGFGPEPYRAWEGFERWIDFKRELGDVGIVLGFFDPLYEGYEDFNEAWDNSSYLFQLPEGRVIVCPFGGGAVDDMQEGWLTEPFARGWDEIGSVVGMFGGDSSEDFEEQWRANEDYAWDLVDVSTETGLFGGTHETESFEGGW